MGKAMSGDFIGFTFNGVHSSTLGIMRVSNGSRYEEDLLPTYQDKVVEAPGSDETYFFGTYYKQKVIQIPFVFNDLTESQIRILKQTFCDKQIHELWFDETPYKAYSVKVNGVPNLRYVCFDVEEGDAEPTRVYKGEGSVSFVAYYPFAHNRMKFLDEYDYSFGNKNEWMVASRLRTKGDLDTPISINETDKEISLWNAGDLCSDFNLNIYFGDSSKIYEGGILLNDEQMLFSTISKMGNDAGIQINTRLKLIQGFEVINGKIQLTNNIYNKYILAGDFFKIPLGASKLKIIELTRPNKKIEIDYKYWYI